MKVCVDEATSCEKKHLTHTLHHTTLNNHIQS